MAIVAIFDQQAGRPAAGLAATLALLSASTRTTLLWDMTPQGCAATMLSPDLTRTPARLLLARGADVARLSSAAGDGRPALLWADLALSGAARLVHAAVGDVRLSRLGDAVAAADGCSFLFCSDASAAPALSLAARADALILPILPSPESALRVGAAMARVGAAGAAILPAHVGVNRRDPDHRDALERHSDWPILPAAPEGAPAPFPPRSPARAAAQLLLDRIERRLARAG